MGKFANYMIKEAKVDKETGIVRGAKTVKDIPEEYQFVDRDIDVKAINDMYGTEFDSFFVIVGDGDYDSVYGMKGIVPDLDKEVVKVK